ncbi:putative guanine nucleotide exchange factor [Phaeomoniella chlamydospora]|uniref:Putative guanine nucleotide exchange factor n=1 Tax=Phaeomoniella chlamydospora TaxID=158046 RepID=A0A0G2EP62_PHACM|nr:putative guanine nucleotide exchange factor [Phaeomoniella chlamydospora]
MDAGTDAAPEAQNHPHETLKETTSSLGMGSHVGVKEEDKKGAETTESKGDPDSGSPSIEKSTEDLQDMSISTATLRPPAQNPVLPEIPRPSTPSLTTSQPQQPYLDPTPATPQTSRPASRVSSGFGEYNEKEGLGESEPASENEFEQRPVSDAEDGTGKESQSEITSIMEQFTDETEAPGKEEIMSPRLELAGPMLALRHKSADPVAKFLRSFLTEFGKKQWMVHEQVKIISDFLAFITNKMAQCDVWRDVSDTEFDNAKEGMEKLVMNRLYSQTFSPAIPPPPPVPRSRSKRKEQERIHGPGRRGQHQEDVERDEVLAQKIRIYSWVSEEHLDIPSVGPNGKRFLALAQQELLKIKGYRAPRDKVICILNCCKVIFGLLKNAKSKDTSADSFIPLLIYVVLHANPEHLVSNVQYILRFRNQDKLGGEAGYYLSSLSGAIQFVESLDRTSLTVTDEEFERNVEITVQAIAERNREAEQNAMSPTTGHGQFSEKAGLGLGSAVPADVGYGESSQRRTQGHQSTLSADSSVAGDDNPAVAGLLRTIQRPLSTLGRIFSDEGAPNQSLQQPALPPRPLSPAVFQPPRDSIDGEEHPDATPNRLKPATGRYAAEEAAARQASAETAQAEMMQRKEHKHVVETLYGMFPNLDRDIIDDVVREKGGRVGLAVDACLALTTT